MKTYVYRGALLLVAMPLLFTSCIYRNVRAPGPVNHGVLYKLDTDDFDIIGTVESTGTYKTWLFAWSTGGNTYVDLQDKARAMGGDEIINYRYNVTHKSIVFFIYNRFSYHATATVIKYKPGVLQNGQFRRQKTFLPDLLPEKDDDEDEEDDDDEDSGPAPIEGPKEAKPAIVPKPAPEVSPDTR